MVVEVEVCIDSVHGARTALEAGVRRLETCASLADGGLTPSVGLVRQIDSWGLGARQMVMIRPRAGDFCYSGDEIAAMECDIRSMRGLGLASLAGFVFGCLAADRRVDEPVMARLVAAAHPLPVTFHRAVDVARDYAVAFDAIIRVGCRCVLTSGGRAKAVDGINNIRAMVARHGDRIDVMAGSGVSPDNASAFVSAGVRKLHFSARARVASSYAAISMGSADTGDGYNSVGGDLVRRMLRNVGAAKL